VSMFPGGLGARIAVTIAGVLAWSWIAAGPIDVVRDCAAETPSAASGIEKLGTACPQLENALQSLGFAPILYDGWRGRLNRDALRDLASLAEEYGGAKPGVSPDPATLPGILKALARERTTSPRSWWDVLKAWLAQHTDALNRLDRWLERIGGSTSLFHAISYSLVALVLIAAAAVLVNEMRAGGAGRWQRRRKSSAHGSSAAVVSADAAGLEPGAPAEGLTELLRALVRRLMQTGRLETERSLTHRELVARSAFDDESQRAVFAAVAGAAESILYGPQGGAPERLNTVLDEGRALLTQLAGPSSAH
jgi:hypothetical protein